MGICHQALFVRGDIIRNLRFDLSYKCCADYNMMMQIYKSGGRFLSLNIPIAVYDTLGFSEIHWKRVFMKKLEYVKWKTLYIIRLFYIKELFSDAFENAWD